MSSFLPPPPLVMAIQTPSLMKGPHRSLVACSKDIDVVHLMMSTRVLYHHDYSSVEFCRRGYDLKKVYEANPIPQLRALCLYDSNMDLFKRLLMNENKGQGQGQEGTDANPGTIWPAHPLSLPGNDPEEYKFLCCQYRLQFVTFLGLTKTHDLDAAIRLVS